MDMIKKFWLGQTPMWFNVWIIGVLFFKVLFYGILFGLNFLKLDFLYIMNIATYISLPLYLVWAVGTWRSAAVYKGSKFWSILAEIYVVITIGALLFGLYLQFTS